MILVAGGALDFNIGALLRRMLRRRVPFCDVLVGPASQPRLTIDMNKDRLRLNGKTIRPTACFMRHDVFLGQTLKTAQAGAVALNWYAAIKGCELAHDEVRGFNKKCSATESNKLRNLYLARRNGLAVPPTVLGNEFAAVRRTLRGALIQKPAAGGELTGDFDAFVAALAKAEPLARYPRFVQPRLLRPELRVYRIGAVFFGFSLASPDLDYRSHQRVRLKAVRVPRDLRDGLGRLCDELGLDFAAADFMRDPGTREFHFLEINSQPMFAAFDEVAGGALSDAIIDHLAPS